MENTTSKEKEILDEIQRKNGYTPNPLKLMQERPGTVETFTAHSKQILEGGPLTKREKALISLASTTALRAGHCINSKVKDARKAGVNEDEITQTILIVSLIVGNAWLHDAYESIHSEDHV